MTYILITGGTGGLGHQVVTHINLDRNRVRIMSRRSRPENLDARLEWAQADLSSGNGLAEAVRGTQTILHLATNPIHMQTVDMEGTRRLLEAACREQIKNFVYISIVGIEHFPKMGYYKSKLSVERLIESSGVPYTILRATQFHSLIDMILRAANRLPFLLLPTDFQSQPIDSGEVAAHLIQLGEEGAKGRVPDLAGPDRLRLSDMAYTWLTTRHIRKPIIRLPVWGATVNAYRRGMNTVPTQVIGKVTWAEWVERRYGSY
ncbi:MAG: NAD(P)H-binding protein [Anaerolineae bacterium]|nr:NAD(P)H-binding protein [Anaerolineae bacterium]